MMKGYRFLALILSMIMIAGVISGCAPNMEDVVATVDGRPIYRWYYNLYLDKQLALHRQVTGVDYTRSENAEEYTKLKEILLDDLIGEAAALNKAEAAGFGTLSADEQSEIEQQYVEFYKQNIEAFMAQYGTDEQALRKAETDYNNWLKDNYLTPERIKENQRNSMILDKYYASISEYGEVSDEEIQEEYDAMLTKQTTENEKTNNAFFGDTPQSITVFYPEGYIEARIMTIPFATKDVGMINDASEAATNLASTVLGLITSSGEEADETKRKQADLDKALKAYSAALETGYSHIQSIADEAYAKLQSGKDWFEVVKETLPDDKNIDYYICPTSTNVDENVRDAAMELKNPGEYSSVIRTSEGLVVVYYVKSIEARTVPLEEVRDQIATSIKTLHTVNETSQIRMESAQQAENVVKYLDKLK